jgi:hypothetical protein
MNECYFFEVNTSKFTENERQIVKEHRWWSQRELGETRDVLTPRALAALLLELLTQGPPKTVKDIAV